MIHVYLRVRHPLGSNLSVLDIEPFLCRTLSLLLKASLRLAHSQTISFHCLLAIVATLRAVKICPVKKS